MLTITPQDEAKLRVLKSLSEVEQQQVLEILAQYHHNQSNLDSNRRADQLLGSSFTKEKRLELEVESLARAFEHRRRLLSDTVTAPKVAEILNTSRQTPHDRVKAQTLLAVMDNGALRFPLWQFSPQEPDGVLLGFSQVLKALQLSDFAKLSWLVRPNPYLEGVTPVEALKNGLVERVLQEAKVAGHGQD
jgi:hypothetical protein